MIILHFIHIVRDLSTLLSYRQSVQKNLRKNFSEPLDYAVHILYQRAAVPHKKISYKFYDATSATFHALHVMC